MKILVLLFLLWSSSAGAKTEKFEGRSLMNGIKFSDYGSLFYHWPQITVRYRTDTREQRFTFANPIAEKALREGVVDYPDGAVFAKVGFVTEDDPLFPSSKVPSGARRYQFMVRDKKKYAETGGWGYALFDANGVTFDENPKTKTMACYACHQIVSSRGQVFSQLLDLRPGPFQKTTLPTQPAEVFLQYQDLKKSKLPARIQALLKASVTELRSLQGPLRKSMFVGTADEIRPALLVESKKTKKPALLLSEDESQFSLLAPLPLAEPRQAHPITCPTDSQAYWAAWTTSVKEKNQRLLQEIVFCDSN